MEKISVTKRLSVKITIDESNRAEWDAELNRWRWEINGEEMKRRHPLRAWIIPSEYRQIGHRVNNFSIPSYFNR